MKAERHRFVAMQTSPASTCPVCSWVSGVFVTFSLNASQLCYKGFSGKKYLLKTYKFYIIDVNDEDDTTGSDLLCRLQKSKGTCVKYWNRCTQVSKGGKRQWKFNAA